MIPNIFVSSTIDDLKYLRDALRDAINELAYNPVMSEYGEIGYINPGTAAESCYRSVKNCHMAVLIIGKRYGPLSSNGMSVTHNEFQTARDNSIPIITFIEDKVLAYKEIYDKDPSANIWKNIEHMDQPNKTFELINEVKQAESFNGLISFKTSADAKRNLKLQIAHFVGEYFGGNIRPIKSEVQEVLAEIKTMRKELSVGGKDDETGFKEKVKYLKTMKFLIDDQHAFYRKFAEQLCGDLDTAVPIIMNSSSFDEMVSEAGGRILIRNTDKISEIIFHKKGNVNDVNSKNVSMTFGGIYVIFKDKEIIMNQVEKKRFDDVHAKLVSQLSKG